MKRTLAISESEFMAQVKQLAELRGFMVYHTHDSRRSDPGMPDLILCRPPRLIFAEIKSERGRFSYHQAVWLAMLDECPPVEVYTWRPDDWSRIEEVLT